MGGHGFDPQLCHTNDVLEKVPDASLLSAYHRRIGLSFLTSQTSLKMRWIPCEMSGK